MAHYRLGRDDAELLVALGLSLQDNSHLLPVSLYELEVLLLRKLKTRHLVMEYANVAEETLLSVILRDASLVAKNDTPEEFGDEQFLWSVWSMHQRFDLLIFELA